MFLIYRSNSKISGLALAGCLSVGVYGCEQPLKGKLEATEIEVRTADAPKDEIPSSSTVPAGTEQDEIADAPFRRGPKSPVTANALPKTQDPLSAQFWLNEQQLVCDQGSESGVTIEVACALVDVETWQPRSTVPVNMGMDFTFKDGQGTAYSLIKGQDDSIYRGHLPGVNFSEYTLFLSLKELRGPNSMSEAISASEAISRAADYGVSLVQPLPLLHSFGGISYSLSTTVLNLDKDNSEKVVTIRLSQPAPADAEIDYFVYGPQGFLLPKILQEPTSKIKVKAGENTATLRFSYKTSVSNFSGYGSLAIVFRGESNATLDIGLYDANARNFDQVSLGTDHGCAIRAGQLFCWGENGLGQLGLGQIGVDFETPQRVGTLTNWTSTEIGSNVSCGIESGRLFCWGRATYGGLGNGLESPNVSSPVEIGDIGPSLADKWSSVSHGGTYGCAINSGKLYCWGRATNGVLANGQTTTNLLVPTQVGLNLTAEDLDKWTVISSASAHSCGINNQRLYCWGSTSTGKVGSSEDPLPAEYLEPREVGSSFPNTWIDVQVAHEHSCAINAGRLYCWGKNDYGQIGSGSSDASVSIPTAVGLLADWESIAPGYRKTCAIRAGQLFCWGVTTTDGVGIVSEPTKVGSLAGWSKISAFDGALGQLVCGINTGKLYCWSSREYETYPYETPGVQTAPARFEYANSWSGHSQGYRTGCGISKGSLYCWGMNDSGQLGVNYYSDGPELPAPVSSSKSWTVVATSGSHTCGIDAGSLYCWGYGSQGQIGDGSLNMRNLLPLRVGTDSTWSAVATGDYHTCGIKTGELYCWGDDMYQAVGNGPGGPREVPLPTRIGSATNWNSVIGGPNSSCAISSGDLYCWGANTNGQLGNGTRLAVTSPMLVSGGKKWTRVSLGSAHSCGISQGRMYCWGRDDLGQLGNGPASSADVLQPEQVGTSSDWEDVSLSSDLTCGINLGRIYCWGAGRTTADLVYSHEPELVDSRTDWTSIQVGYSEVYAIRDETIWGWGLVFGDFRLRNGSPGTE